jgi:Flp pilus assembly protein TadG
MRDRGSASAELVFVTPVLILIGLVAFVIGRLVLDKGQVIDAARSAAEAAAVWPTISQARGAALVTASYEMQRDGLVCEGARVSLLTVGFAAGGNVRVSVTCPVEVLNAVPGLPSSIALTAAASAPIEPFREVG